MPLTKKFKPGEVLFSRGELPGAMYVLLEGRLSVVVGEECLATLSETGAFVGEMSFLTGNPRTADVRAETDSRVLVISDIERFFEDDPRRALAVARELARRFDALHKKFLDLKHVASTPGPPAGKAIEAAVHALSRDSAATAI